MTEPRPTITAEPIVLASGARLAVRPIRRDDRDRLHRMFRRLSPESRRRRFLVPKATLSSRELDYLTDVDHRRHEALVAVLPADGSIAGVARYAAWPDSAGRAELAVVVADEWQGRGLGSALCRRLLDRAREEGMSSIDATTLADNGVARALLRRLGFRARSLDGAEVELHLPLPAPPPAARAA